MRLRNGFFIWFISNIMWRSVVLKLTLTNLYLICVVKEKSKPCETKLDTRETSRNERMQQGMVRVDMEFYNIQMIYYNNDVNN